MANPNALAALLGGGIVLAGLGLLAILIVPTVFYLLCMQKALTLAGRENREMEPGMVWLMFIPLFNIVWHFFVVMNMAKSLGCEFQKRGTAEDPKPGQTIGMVMCILACCGIIPILGILCSLGGFVCWIIYWVKIADYSSSGRRSSDARRARRHPFPNASSARTSPLRPC